MDIPPFMRTETIFSLLLVILTTACSPDFKLPAPKTGRPELTGEAIISADGTWLPLRTWLPEGDLAAVMVALHGFNDYSYFIHDTAIFLAERGIAVYAYDQRGFGAGPHRGLWPGSQALIDDLKTVTGLLHDHYPDLPLYILGESMGGAVVMAAMADADPPETDGVILAAPAVWSRTSMTIPQRVLLWIAAHTLPWAKVSGKSLRIRASDNTKMLEQLGRDPLVIKKTRIDTIYGLTNLMDDAYNAAGHIAVPALFLYGEKDEVIPRKPVLQTFNRCANAGYAGQRFIIYKNGYHMLLRDLQADIVRKDILAWLDKSPLPLPLPLPSTVGNQAVELSGKIWEGWHEISIR